VIQEKLRDRLDTAQAARITELDENPDSPATVEGLVQDLRKYLEIAEAKCFDALDHVLELIRRHLGSSFFAYDASLVRDGCFFAGHTLALMPGRDEDVKVCLQALSEMRWAFSKGHERSQTIRLAWKSRTESQKHPNAQRTPDLEHANVSEGWTPPGGQPPSKQSPDTSHHYATSPISSYTPQHQHINVASLPSHSAATISPQAARRTPQQSNPNIQRQYSAQHNSGVTRSGVPSRLDMNVVPGVSYIDTGTAHGLQVSWSPVHQQGAPVAVIPQATVSTSTQSSSSDGSSPPELNATSAPQYQLAKKSPSPYDHVQAPPQHFPRDGSLPISPTRVNPPRAYPQPPHVPLPQYQRGTMAAPQHPQAHHSQYIPVFNGHPQASPRPYNTAIASNGPPMQGHVLNLRSQGQVQAFHPMPYVADPHSLTPEEMSQFTTGTDYFPPRSETFAAPRELNGTPAPVTDDSSSYFQYTDNGVYYVQR
jgi:hypothetical protein